MKVKIWIAITVASIAALTVAIAFSYRNDRSLVQQQLGRLRGRPNQLRLTELQPKFVFMTWRWSLVAAGTSTQDYSAFIAWDKEHMRLVSESVPSANISGNRGNLLDALRNIFNDVEKRYSYFGEQMSSEPKLPANFSGVVYVYEAAGAPWEWFSGRESIRLIYLDGKLVSRHSATLAF